MQGSRRGRGRQASIDPAAKWNSSGFSEGLAKIESEAWAENELEGRLTDAVRALRSDGENSKAIKQAVLKGVGRLIRRGLGKAAEYLDQPKARFYREFLTSGLEAVYDGLDKLASGEEPEKTYRIYIKNQIIDTAKRQFERDVWHRERAGKKKRYRKFQSTADESCPPRLGDDRAHDQRAQDSWEEQFHDQSQTWDGSPKPAYLNELRARWGERSNLYRLAELLTQDGMTNREAAEILDCSTKTIERHRPKVEAALADIRKDYGYGRA